MASRYYFDNTALGATTSNKNANWNEDLRSVANQIRTLLPTTTGNNGFSYENAQAAANGHFSLHVVYRASLTAGLLITGNMRGELVGARTAGATQVSPAIAVNIRNASDVVVANLITYFPSPSNGYANSPNGTVFPTPPSTAITDAGYVTQVGDFLYVEVGIGWLNVASNAGPVIGGLVANTDWAAGDSGLPGANPQVMNPWIEFETTLAPASILDDPLPTFSGSSTSVRPATPSKLGLQFYARDTGIESIWDGSSWKNMVASINANGGTSVGGNLTFNNTTSVNVANSSGTFTWIQNYAAPSGGYGTSATAGTAGTTSIASDARFVFPEALATLADRTKTWTMTDAGGGLAVFTFAGFASSKEMQFKAPGAVNFMSIGQWGNIGMGGNNAADNSMLIFSKVDFNDATTVSGLNMTLSNVGSGGCNGMTVEARHSPTSASALETVGFKLTTKQNTVNATGNLIGARGIVQVVGAATRSKVAAWTTQMIGAVGGTISTGIHYEIFNAAIAGTVTKQVGLMQSAAFSTGATRRSAELVNSIDITANDLIFSTAAKGIINKDTQGTPEFWRTYISSTGTKDATLNVDNNGYTFSTRAASPTGTVTLNIQDVGTAAPTT